jgi:hypothetical protein
MCLDGALADYAPWHRTAVYFPMNPLAGDQTSTTEVMQRCAASATAGGPWCVLANNALSPLADTTGRSAPTYAEMEALWSASPKSTPIAFQMNGPNAATYCGAIAVAVAHHAQSVEMWPAAGGQAGYTGVSTTTLQSWSQDLRAGVDPAC